MATERLELHEAVLDAQARLGQGVAIVDIESMRIVYANEAVAAMSGYSVAEILELPSFLALPPASGDSSGCDTFIDRKDGTRLDVELSVHAIESEPNLVVALLRDITRRKRAERALRESEARLRALVTGAPVLMWTVNRDGVFTMAEGNALAELGVASLDIVGRSIEKVHAPMPEVLPHYERAFAGESAEATIDWGGRTMQAYLVADPPQPASRTRSGRARATLIRNELPGHAFPHHNRDRPLHGRGAGVAAAQARNARGAARARGRRPDLARRAPRAEDHQGPRRRLAR